MSIHPPTETKIFTGEGLLYSIPINDDRRGSLRVSKILRVVLPIALIVVVYAREPMGTLFGYNAFSLIPLPIWLLLLVTLGGANTASAFGRVRTERTRHLAFWGLTLKLCFLPIFLVNFFVIVVTTGQLFPFSPEALVLGLALVVPSATLSCALMVVSSCYGFAAIIRARNEHLLSPETAKKYMLGHAIPVVDLVSSIRLYLLLGRLNGTVATNVQVTNQPSHTLSVAQPVPLIDNTVTTRSPRASQIPWLTVASLAASFCFVVTAYAGGPFTMAFPSPFPTLRIDIWPLVMIAFATATVACTHFSRNTRTPRELAFWGLVIKLSFLPFFLVACLLILFLGQYLFAPGYLAPHVLCLPPALLGSYIIMIVTSSHGFAAIARARDEQLISHETAKQYKRGHAIPIADLLSSIRLYMLLRRVDSTVPTIM
jgi:hypothetical protein